RRTDYHQVLSEALKEHYDLVGIETYRVRRGDSLWLLSNQLGFPVWLLYRLNPMLRAAELQVGQAIALPKLKAKT
ncbi:MAG: LysM peptidoglycan-binding domain-containing protein, partial [bacterium]